MFRNKQNRHSRSRSRQQRSGINYQSLEARKMLATVLYGTSGNDTAHVAYVDDTHVTVTINETVHENVDITDGLRINLGGEALRTEATTPSSPSGEVNLTFISGQDTVNIDHRIVGDVGVYGAEVVEVDGGDNEFFIRFVPNPVEQVENDSEFTIRSPGTTIGNLNGNIKLGGFHSITTGDGQDTFNINTDSDYHLSVKSGDGDDLFRINANRPSGQGPISFNGSSLRLLGEAGNDRFQFRGEADAPRFFGGEGYDVVDYSRSTLDGVSVNVAIALGLPSTVFAFQASAGFGGFEKVIGAEGKLNSLDATTGDYSTLNWFVNGRRSRVLDPSTGESIVFENFNEFNGNRQGTGTRAGTGIDRFWVLRTAADISIFEADEIQISSTINALEGNLNSIQHNVSIANDPTNVLFSPLDSPTLLNPIDFAPPSEVTGGEIAPLQVTISDAQGDGTAARFGTSGNNKFIAGLTHSGSIRFLDGIDVAVTVHGSVSESDFLRIDSGWSDLDINTHGGNDAFFVGSSDGGLDGITNVNIAAGSGTDRLYGDDQTIESANQITIGSKRNTYSLTENSFSRIRHTLSTFASDVILFADENPAIFQETEVSPLSIIYNEPLLISSGGLSEIAFDSDLEVVRVAGSQDGSNEFAVTPSTTTTFIAIGAAFTDPIDSLASRMSDVLRVQGPLAEGAQLQNGMEPRTGSVAFEGQAQAVFFEDLTFVDSLFPLEDRLIGLEQSLAVETSQAEGRPVRIASIDGEQFPLTADVVADRLNLNIEQGLVVRVTLG